MARRRRRQPSRRARLVATVIRYPNDWHGRILERKSEKQSAADYVRRLIYRSLDDDPKRPLSEPPVWGKQPG